METENLKNNIIMDSQIIENIRKEILTVNQRIIDREADNAMHLAAISTNKSLNKDDQKIINLYKSQVELLKALSTQTK
jgi:hypothetical protein